jgi:bacterioferritin
MGVGLHASVGCIKGGMPGGRWRVWADAWQQAAARGQNFRRTAAFMVRPRGDGPISHARGGDHTKGHSMKGPAVSLKHLQRAATMELTTVNQYLLQAHALEDWGVDRLAKHMFQEVKEESGHASRYIARMLFLDGKPNVRELDEIEYPKTVKGIFERQLKMELEARTYYDKAARECQEAGDTGSFELFMRTLKDEEGHIDFLEEQLTRMELMGEQAYIARQISSVSGDSEEDDE